MFQHCQWIWGTANAQADEYFDFDLCFPVQAGSTYCLYIACDTEYALYYENELVAFGQYPDYPEYRVYDTFPLSCVREGVNHLRLTVWYQGVNFKTYIQKPAGVIFKITEDGRELLCSTEAVPSRRTSGYVPHLCRSISPQLGLTFSYDATALEQSYTHVSYIVENVTKTLYPRPVEKLTLCQRMEGRIVQQGGYILQGGEETKWRMQQAALSTRMNFTKDFTGAPIVLRANPGEEGVFLIVDMLRETAGFLDLEFDVPMACDVMIGWGEHLLDGRCRTAVRNFSCDYRAHEGMNLWLHPFRRLGCRYLQIFIAAPEVSVTYVGIRETVYPVKVKSYSGKNLLRNRICQVSVNTLRQCMHEHYEDCPWREQGLYTMDSRNQMLCGYYAFGETAFPKACLNLISKGMREDGLLAICYPAGSDRPIPSFSLIYFVQVWEYFQHSGDLAFLREKYPFLKTLMETFLSRSREDGLICVFWEKKEYWNFYEWSSGMNGSERWDHPVYDAPLNAYLSIALQRLADIARQLREEEDALQYLEIASWINRVLVSEFYNEEVQLFRSFTNRRQDEYSVLTNSLCVLCGAAQNIPIERIWEALVKNDSWDSNITVIPSTLSMNIFRFDALLMIDFQHAKSIVLDEIDRIYLQMLEQGATSFWETLDGAADFEGAGSLCHGWSALPVYYYDVLEGLS